MIVYRLTDRIPVIIGDLTFLIAPMSFEQKIAIMESGKMAAGKETKDMARSAVMAMKYSVKSVKGLKNADGSDYELTFDESGNLSDESISELLQVEQYPKLLEVTTQFVNGIKDPKIKGVTVDLQGVTNVKKNTP